MKTLRLAAVLLCLALCLLPLTALGADCDTWTALSSGGTLSTGSYSLSADSTDSLTIPDGAVVHLCVHGHKLGGANRTAITIQSGGELHLHNCQSSGGVYSTGNYVVHVQNGGVLHMHKGRIEQGSTNANRRAVKNDGTFYMDGGILLCKSSAGALNMEADGAVAYIRGGTLECWASNAVECTADCDIYLSGSPTLISKNENILCGHNSRVHAAEGANRFSGTASIDVTPRNGRVIVNDVTEAQRSLFDIAISDQYELLLDNNSLVTYDKPVALLDTSELLNATVSANPRAMLNNHASLTITVTPDAGAFFTQDTLPTVTAVDAGRVLPGALQADGSCTFAVRDLGRPSTNITFRIAGEAQFPAPAFTAAPTAVDFGSVFLDEVLPAAQSVTITNTGNVALSLSASALTHYTLGNFPATLAVGQDATFTVAPNADLDAAGNYDESLAISADGCETQSVSLLFAITEPPAPSFTVSPTALDFGSVALNHTRPSAKSVTVTNTGNVPLTLSKSAPSHYTLQDFPTTLAVGEASAFTVVPNADLDAEGVYNETLSISASGCDDQAVSLAFTLTEAQLPSFTLSEATLDFGSVALNHTRPAAKSVTVTNTGNVPLTLSKSALVNYTIQNFPETLAVGQNATFTVMPNTSLNAEGIYDAALSVSASGCADQAVALLFTLTEAQLPAFTLSPATVDFGSVPLDQARPAAKSVTVTNTGNVPLTLSGSSLSHYTLQNVPETLDVGQNATFTVEPSAALDAEGVYNETLTVSAAGCDAQAVTLRFALTSAIVSGRTIDLDNLARYGQSCSGSGWQYQTSNKALYLSETYTLVADDPSTFLFVWVETTGGVDSDTDIQSKNVAVNSAGTIYGGQFAGSIVMDPGGTLMGGVFSNAVTCLDDSILHVPAGASLTIAEGGLLHLRNTDAVVNGTLQNRGDLRTIETSTLRVLGSLYNAGRLDNSGTLYLAALSGDGQLTGTGPIYLPLTIGVDGNGKLALPDGYPMVDTDPDTVWAQARTEVFLTVTEIDPLTGWETVPEDLTINDLPFGQTHTHSFLMPEKPTTVTALFASAAPNGGVPQTGDSTPIALLCALAAVTLTGCLMLGKKRKAC